MNHLCSWGSHKVSTPDLRESPLFVQNVNTVIKVKDFFYHQTHSTFQSVGESKKVGDLVQRPFIPPVHLRDGFAARSLDDDHYGAGQHADPAQPEQYQQHPAGSHPPTCYNIHVRFGKCLNNNLQIQTDNDQVVFCRLLPRGASHLHQLLLGEAGECYILIRNLQLHAAVLLSRKRGTVSGHRLLLLVHRVQLHLLQVHVCVLTHGWI